MLGHWARNLLVTYAGKREILDHRYWLRREMALYAREGVLNGVNSTSLQTLTLLMFIYDKGTGNSHNLMVNEVDVTKASVCNPPLSSRARLTAVDMAVPLGALVIQKV